MPPNNPLPIHGNEKTMNLNHLILTNIQSSPYFKVNLYELKTYHEVIDEIYYKVDHLEPWEKGSRKTAGQTGMCGGVRGVGAGGIVSSAYCLLYKLFTLKLTRKQLNGLITHTDSPYIRGLGFMYIRYTQPPSDLWDWYGGYLEDDEELDVKAGGGQMMSIGELARQWLVKIEWYSTLFPRIPVPVQKTIQMRLREYDAQHHRAPMVAEDPVEEYADGEDGYSAVPEAAPAGEEEPHYGEAERQARMQGSGEREPERDRDRERADRERVRREWKRDAERERDHEKDRRDREDRPKDSYRGDREKDRERGDRERGDREKDRGDRDRPHHSGSYDFSKEIMREKERQRKEKERGSKERDSGSGNDRGSREHDRHGRDRYRDDRYRDRQYPDVKSWDRREPSPARDRKEMHRTLDQARDPYRNSRDILQDSRDRRDPRDRHERKRSQSPSRDRKRSRSHDRKKARSEEQKRSGTPEPHREKKKHKHKHKSKNSDREHSKSKRDWDEYRNGR